MVDPFDGIDVRHMRGLEIGALHNPRLPRESPNVFFVDHASTDELRAKYADDDHLRESLDALVEVDIVWGADNRTLAEATKEHLPFDFVFASHVFEHLPDPIGWLHQLWEVLVPGGIVSLIIPDKRFCFDINRQESEISDLIDGYLGRRTTPSFRQIYDFHSKIISVDTAAVWAGDVDYRGTWRTDLDPDDWAYELCTKAANTGEYIDSHCGVYTPTSFLGLMNTLAKLDLLPFRIKQFQHTEVGSLEFRVVLERIDATDPEHRRRLLRDSVRRFSLPADVAHTRVNQIELGPRELKAIALKRKAVDQLHSVKFRLARALSRSRRA